MPTIPTLNSLVGSVANVTSAGNYAGGVASLVTGGVGSIAVGVGALANASVSGAISNLSGAGTSLVSGALGKITGAIGGIPSIPTAKGVAGAAFSAITDSFKPFKAGVPQNLTKIAAANAAEVTKVGAGTLGSVTGVASSALGSVLVLLPI